MYTVSNCGAELQVLRLLKPGVTKCHPVNVIQLLRKRSLYVYKFLTCKYVLRSIRLERVHLSCVVHGCISRCCCLVMHF
jgi:hypothetical protein